MSSRKTVAKHVLAVRFHILDNRRNTNPTYFEFHLTSVSMAKIKNYAKKISNTTKKKKKTIDADENRRKGNILSADRRSNWWERNALC